jgi:UDP-N-acetyl-D-mannosaminuronate dehydrogenase
MLKIVPNGLFFMTKDNHVNYSTLCVIGMGYIGLPTASIFASNGLQVTGMDTNAKIIDGLKAGQLHIFEPGLRDLLLEVLRQQSPEDLRQGCLGRCVHHRRTHALL